jgi:hypothetical protein
LLKGKQEPRENPELYSNGKTEKRRYIRKGKK